MKHLITLVAAAFAVLGAAAQTDHCVAFSIGKPKENSTLSAENLKTLELKCTQIVTRSNAAKTALYSAFVVTPTIDILGDRTVMAGTADVTVVEAELTLVAENSVDGSKYGSVTVKLEGSGNSRARALNSLVQGIQPTSGAFVNFIKKATAQIIDYYSNNMGRVLTQAQNLVAAERYEDALNFLNSVPICVPAFEQSADAVAGLFKMVADKNCSSALTMGRRYASIGDYAHAEEVLLGVKPGSSCDAEIQALLGTIKANKDSLEASKPVAAPVAVVPTAVPVPAEEVKPAAAAPAVAPAPAPAAAPSADITNPFKTLSFKLASVVGNKADNTVVVTLTVSNVSDLVQEVYLPYNSRGIMLYNADGDSFESNGVSERNFKLPSGLSQKITFRFPRVGTSNARVSFVATFHDQQTGNKAVEARNLTIDWQ